MKPPIKLQDTVQVGEAFLVRAGERMALLPLTWRTAYLHPGVEKTSLALTRARSREIPTRITLSSSGTGRLGSIGDARAA